MPKSSSESEFEPLGPPRRSFYFQLSLLYLVNPEGFYDMHYLASKYFAGFYINCVDPDDEGVDFDGIIPKEMCSLAEREDERHAQPVIEIVVFNKLER